MELIERYVRRACAGAFFAHWDDAITAGSAPDFEHAGKRWAEHTCQNAGPDHVCQAIHDAHEYRLTDVQPTIPTIGAVHTSEPPLRRLE